MTVRLGVSFDHDDEKVRPKEKHPEGHSKVAKSLVKVALESGKVVVEVEVEVSAEATAQM